MTTLNKLNAITCIKIKSRVAQYLKSRDEIVNRRMSIFVWSRKKSDCAIVSPVSSWRGAAQLQR